MDFEGVRERAEALRKGADAIALSKEAESGRDN